MSKKKATELSSLSQDRGDLIAELLDKFEAYLNDAGISLSEKIIKEFLDKLKMENGKITNDADNIRKNALIDKAWSSFASTVGVDIINKFVTDLNTINNENLKYYRKLSDANIKSSDIRNIIFARLGIDENGNLVKGGYMKGLLDDVSVRNEIKQFSYKKMLSGTGYDDLRKGLSDLINGNQETMGKFKQFYRNFAYDTYVQTDRLNASLYAETLDLKYFIYQGTKRRDSRYFCIQRKDKIFTTDEAKEWVHLIGTTTEMEVNGKMKRVPAGPIVSDKATYNPVIDMGGFGCVDVASFISEEVAYALRPELKNRMTVSEDYTKKYEGKDGANVYVHKDADANDLDYNLRKAKILADNGESVKIRMHSFTEKVKNPEIGTIDGKLADFKAPQSIKTTVSNFINNAMASARRQKAEIPILIFPDGHYNSKEALGRMYGLLKPGINSSISEVWFIIDDMLYKVNRQDVISRIVHTKIP